MLASDGPKWGYAQVGYIRYWNGYSRGFTEFTDATNPAIFYRNVYGGQMASGGVHHFGVGRTVGVRLNFYDGATLVGYTSYDPVYPLAAPVWSQPMNNQYNSESAWVGSDEPGYSATRVYQSNIQWHHPSLGWLTQGCGLARSQPSHPRATESSVNGQCNQLQMWT